MKTLITATLLISTLSLSAFAGGGSADTGGGNAVGNQLLDVFENEGTTTVRYAQLKAYKEVVKPILENTESKIPFSTELLLSGVEGKVWLLDSKPLSRKACLNSSMIEVAKEVVGCQNHLEVRLYKPWYDKVNARQQAALIIHELVRGLSLSNRDYYQMSDEDVAFVTRTLLQIEQYDEGQLIDIFARTSVTRQLAPYSAYVSLNKKILMPDYRKLCMGNQRTNPWNSLISLSEITMNFTYSEGERDAAYKIRNEMDSWSSDETYIRNKVCKTYNEYITKFQ